MKRSTRQANPRRLHGELRQKLHLSLASNSPWRVKGEQGNPRARHGEQNYSRGELRRPNLFKLTWQKPIGDESSTRHGENTYSRGELRENQRELKEQGAQGLKESPRSLRHHGLLISSLLFSL
ncbi:hypothetical protein MTR_6g039190 [Medicago truncatula]|uniref:Uncharacterized protein n=1 Tax=Medicago truncatula TaxID=3880 RepID=A0A072UJJ0_MEDTR|nr:hypothetical protein MTR_6g039190 [Medicago truncatula]